MLTLLLALATTPTVTVLPTTASGYARCAVGDQKMVKYVPEARATGSNPLFRLIGGRPSPSPVHSVSLPDCTLVRASGTSASSTSGEGSAPSPQP